MTRHRSKPTHVYLSIITTQCSKHGPHRLIVGALEDETRAAAQLIATHLCEQGRVVSLDHQVIPIGAIGLVPDPDSWIHDDLPY